MIDLNNFTYLIGDRYLFENVNLNLNNGTYCLRGKNGTGKSTFLNLLYNNKKHKGISFKDNYSITYLNQEFMFFENLSIKENINLLVKKDKKLIEKKFLSILDLDLNQKVKFLSGGEKQILNILLAFSKNSDIYLIDEPFNNLSSSKEEVVKSLILDIFSKAKMVIVVDHYEKIKCDNILEIFDREINVIL